MPGYKDHLSTTMLLILRRITTTHTLHIAVRPVALLTMDRRRTTASLITHLTTTSPIELCMK
jgi:hypothetical protein